MNRLPFPPLTVTSSSTSSCALGRDGLSGGVQSCNSQRDSERDSERSVLLCSGIITEESLISSVWKCVIKPTLDDTL